MNRFKYPADQDFIETFCAHAMTRYGLCLGCGTCVTEKMFEHIRENYKAGDCPWCANAEPNEIYKGSPVDWECKNMDQPCSLIRGGEREGMDCPKYRPRKVEVKGVGILFPIKVNTV